MKLHPKKAQIAVETIFTVSILLILLLTIVLINYSRENLISELNNSYSEINECNELALLISTVYSEGPFTRAEFSLNKSAEIENNYLQIGETRCEFVGRVQDVSLNKGQIIAKNTNGVVVLEEK